MSLTPPSPVPARNRSLSYPWCRRCRTGLEILGKLSFAIAAFLLVYTIYAFIVLGANGSGLERAVWSIAVWSFAAMFLLVSGELLGGAVAFLIQHDCPSGIDPARD